MIVEARDQRTVDSFTDAEGIELRICFGTAEAPAEVKRHLRRPVTVIGDHHARIWDNTVYARDDSCVEIFGTSTAFRYENAKVHVGDAPEGAAAIWDGESFMAGRRVGFSWGQAFGEGNAYWEAAKAEELRRGAGEIRLYTTAVFIGVTAFLVILAFAKLLGV